MSDQYGPYPVRSRHRGVVVAQVTFDGANGADGADVSDPSGVLVATGTKVTWAAEGTYRLNLRSDWQGIHANPQLLSATDDDNIMLEAISLTPGANTVTVRAEAAGTPDDMDGIRYSVLLHLFIGDDAASVA